MKSFSLIRLYLIYIKIGAILLGGGYVILPILLNEFVEKRKLISKDELVDYFALSQSLPGIIAANISMFVGCKIRGVLGSIVAMFGIITVPFILIIILASTLCCVVQNIYIQAVFWGVGIAVIALIMLTVREIYQNSVKDLFFYIVYLLALICLIIFNFSPIKTILIFVPLGVLYKFLMLHKESE